MQIHFPKACLFIWIANQIALQIMIFYEFANKSWNFFFFFLNVLEFSKYLDQNNQ